MNSLLASTLVLSLLAAEPESDEQRARALVRSAQNFFREGRFAEAAGQFRDALALRPRPALHFNLARCSEELGDVAGAMKEYREYLRLAPEATDRAVVQERVSALEVRLASKGLRQALVLVEPPQATISVDGKELGASPAYVELPPGVHQLRAAAPGFAAQERPFTIDGPRSVEVRVRLAGEDAPVVRAEPTLVPSTPPPMPVVSAEPSPAPRRVGTWIALGAAVAATATATGLGIAANGASTELRGASHTRAQADQLVAQTRDFSTGANVAWGVAGAAVVTGVVLFIVEGAR